MTKFFQIFVLALTLGSATVALSACANTWQGAGKDVENVGDDMQDSYN